MKDTVLQVLGYLLPLELLPRNGALAELAGKMVREATATTTEGKGLSLLI